jgi:hypothetical protein
MKNAILVPALRFASRLALVLGSTGLALAQTQPCVSMNWGGTLRYTTSNVYEFAIQATNGSSILVFDRLEFYTLAISAPRTVTIRIFDAPGPMSSSGKVLASGVMSMSTTLGSHTVQFASPAIVPANSTFWIDFDQASYIYMPTSLPGIYQTHYWYGPSGWNGPYTGTWNYRLYCTKTATFTTFGQGCKGTASCRPASLATWNWTESLASATTSAKKIGLFEIGLATTTDPVCGFAMRCRARTGKVQVQVAAHEAVFQSSALLPGALLGSGTMSVDTAEAAYATSFAKPFAVPSSGMLLFVFEQADQLVLPIATTGQLGIHVEHDGNAWSALQTNKAWIYSVHTVPTAAAPELAASGRPVLGQKFEVVLSKARPSTASLFFLGLSDRAWGPIPLPLSLQPHAPGCSLYASGEVIVTMLTDSLGNARVGLNVPNAPALAGASFFTQFQVYDPGANALAMAGSNAGKATMEKY